MTSRSEARQADLFLPQRAEQNDRAAAVALGHESADRGAAKADRLDPGWLSSARRAFARYAELSGDDAFLAIDARKFAVQECGVKAPTDARHWGSIPLAMQRLGIVIPVGGAYPRHTHGVKMTLWKWTGKRLSTEE